MGVCEAPSIPYLLPCLLTLGKGEKAGAEEEAKEDGEGDEEGKEDTCDFVRGGTERGWGLEAEGGGGDFEGVR